VRFIALASYLIIGSLVILQISGSAVFSQRPGADDPCSEKRYQLAEGAYNAKDFNQAKILAGRLLQCPESISSKAQKLLDRISKRERNNSLAAEAFVAIRRRRFDTACSLLARIKESDPSYPNLDWYLTQAGGCVVEDIQPKLDPIRRLLDKGDMRKATADLQILREAHPDNRDIAQLQERASRMAEEVETRRVSRDYQRSRQLIESKRFLEAQTILTRLQEEAPGYQDVAQLLEYVKREQERLRSEAVSAAANSGQEAKTPEVKVPYSKTPNAETKVHVDQLISAGEYQQALRAIEAEGQGPSDLEQTAHEIRARLIEEDKVLMETLTSFYSGRYESAERALTRFLGEAHSRKSRSLARFYLGASIASLHFLGGKSGTKRESEARDIFLSIKREDRDFRPIWDGISPRIRLLYQGSSGLTTPQQEGDGNVANE